MSENPNPDVSTLTSHPQSITLTPSRALLRHSPKFQGNHFDSFSFCFPLSRSFRPGLLPTLSQIALLASFCRLGAFSSALFSPKLNLVSPSTVFSLSNLCFRLKTHLSPVSSFRAFRHDLALLHTAVYISFLLGATL